MGKKKAKQHNKSKNRNGSNANNTAKPNRETGQSENVRVIHGEENNPHDG